MSENANPILELNNAGLTPKEISARIGCSAQNVYQTLRRNGVQFVRNERNGLHRCRRCTWAWPENPVGPDGLCEWCRIELAGHRLRDVLLAG